MEDAFLLLELYNTNFYDVVGAQKRRIPKQKIVEALKL
jgi:hypothetical protein